MIVTAELLYDGRTKAHNKNIVVQDGIIIDVTDKTSPGDVSGIVTPAFIDAHSHIGMERQGEPLGESEVDDIRTPFSPMHNPVDSIYFDDRAFSEAVDFGVLHSCVVPGSGNLLGGRAVVVRNYAPDRSTAVVKDYGYKMALGYNPRAAMDGKGARHNTRMGNAGLLEKEFGRVLRKVEKAGIQRERELYRLETAAKESGIPGPEKQRHVQWIEKEFDLALSEAEWAVYGMLTGEKTIKVHVHKEDDALYLVELKKRFNLRVTAEHGCGIFRTEIFNTLADNDIPLVYGPLVSFDYKTELRTASYKNVAALAASRAKIGLMTDHPVVPVQNLRDSLKYFLIRGTAPETAIGLITLDNAEILGLSGKMGSVEPGKEANLVVWDKDPFHLSAFPRLVMAEGGVLRDRR